MRRGLYRFDEPGGESFTCVDWTAGDGAPFLSRTIYETLGFEPKFDALPEFADFARRHDWAPVPLFLRKAAGRSMPMVSG